MGEHATLVQISFKQESDPASAQEFFDLVHSAGATIAEFITGTRYSPEPSYFIGSGKVEEVQYSVEKHDSTLVIFDHALSPGQQRNLEKRLKCRVVDRAGLILDIFAQRARSHEGKLQVELAQLKHLSTRLVRGWTHLERQKGGIGMRGPGETQLETDRRLLAVRIKQINKRLEKVRNQRTQGRQSRRKAEIPTISLVGYTNAGKSTLFNRLTQANVYSADQLFATLDPTLRRIDLPNQQQAILADTVGFIRHLPHDLVAAFHSTLQETVEADLLLHVIDSQSDQRDLFRDQVNAVIEEIGAINVPQLEIYNKIDLGERGPGIERQTGGMGPDRIRLSAETGAGIDLLLDYLGEYFGSTVFSGTLTFAPRYGRLRSRLYEAEAVQSEQISKQGDFMLTVEMQQSTLESFLEEEALTLESLQLQQAESSEPPKTPTST